MCALKDMSVSALEKAQKYEVSSGAPNEDIVQNHLT